jgi:hypothetical protein
MLNQREKKGKGHVTGLFGPTHGKPPEEQQRIFLTILLNTVEVLA